MNLAIIDYGSGNLRSAAKAFERVAGGAAVQVTRSPEVVAQASHIVLPGVGAFADCMLGLRALPGMLETLEREVLQQKKPFLGICVGMQMLFEKGHEHGTHDGLGWLEGEVMLLEPDNRSLKVPHMGWNDLRVSRPHPLLEGIQSGDHAYFVHSYHAMCKHAENVLATVAYGQNVTAVVGQGNIMGAQFHPEKSQQTGLRLLKNFLSM
jgi:imidazole glycerol-phosphate synthase subunit HisH